MSWTITGNIRGPQGVAGATGAVGPQGEVGATGATGPQGPVGSQGIAGPPGVSIDIEGYVATYADLPANPPAGAAYVVTASGLLYFNDGSGWPDDGDGVPFVGPQGPVGPQGAVGAQGPSGSDGATGATGAVGATGERGSKWFTGAGVPSGVSGSIAGDMYLDTQTGDVYTLS